MERKYSNEKEMSDAVFKKFGPMLKADGYKRKYAAREVPINAQRVERDAHRDSRFDLVKYDRVKGLFRVIEFKMGYHRNAIREAFVQVARYRQALSGNACTFLDAFTRKSPMRFGRLMESTCGATKISVEFYIGLTDEACRNWEFLQEMKKQYPDTGIVRVKENGRIKNYIKKSDGTPDYEIARASAVCFPVAWSPVASSFKRRGQAAGGADIAL